MRRIIVGLSALGIFALPAFAFADDRGAVTGAAGGAVTGAIVGGPVGAAVGAAAGGVIGGVASGPGSPVVEPVQVVPVVPCRTRTTTTSDNMGNSAASQTTNCPD